MHGHAGETARSHFRAGYMLSYDCDLICHLGELIPCGVQQQEGQWSFRQQEWGQGDSAEMLIKYRVPLPQLGHRRE